MQENLKDRKPLGFLIFYTAIPKLFFNPKFANKSLSEVMADIAEKAEKRGLTPKILEEINCHLDTLIL